MLSFKNWGSWKTTLMGIATILIAVGTQLKNMFDNDPTTALNWEALTAGVAIGLGLIAARDNKVADESAGAAKPAAGSKMTA